MRLNATAALNTENNTAAKRLPPSIQKPASSATPMDISTQGRIMAAGGTAHDGSIW